MNLLMLAQADPLSGGAGWAGAGLLGLVLLWLLLRHLPEQDRKQERMAASHEATMASALTAQRNDFLASLSEERLDFKESLERVLHHHEEQTAHLVAAIDKDAQLTRQLITESKRRNDREDRS